MTDPNPDPTTVAQAALESVRDEWRARHGVVALEVARRWRDGQPTDEVGIRVTVEQLLPAAEVREGELFPGTLHDVPVDIVEGKPPQLEAVE